MTSNYDSYALLRNCLSSFWYAMGYKIKKKRKLIFSFSFKRFERRQPFFLLITSKPLFNYTPGLADALSNDWIFERHKLDMLRFDKLVDRNGLSGDILWVAL